MNPLHGIRSLAVRLMALVALTLVPVFVLVIWSSSNERDRARASAEASLTLAARSGAASFSMIVEETRRLLATTALVPGVQQQLPGACDLLTNLTEVDRRYFGLALAGADGMYVCQTLEGSSEGVSVADRQWFRTPRFEGRPTSQVIPRGRISNATVLVLSHPVTNASGDVGGVVAAAFSLRERLPVGTALAPRVGGMEIIGSGLVLAGGADGTVEPSPVIDEQRLFLESGASEHMAEVQGVEGLELLATARIEALPTLAISVRASEMALFADLDAAFARSLGILAILTLVSLAMAFVVAQLFLARPLADVVKAAEALGGGDMNVRANITWGPHELLLLGSTFDAMAESIQERDHEIRQATKAIHESNERLAQAQKMEAVGQLTGGIAHDFNNLLTVIQGNLELLAEEGEDEEMDGFLKSALKATRSGAELTGRLLQFSRKQALAPRLIKLNVLALDMKDILVRTLGEEVQVRCDCSPEGPECVADAGQLESVLLNLSINARDAMPNGGRLTIATGFANLANGDAPDERYATLSVADTGVGMSPEIAGRAIEPFFTTKERGRGTGLGLSGAYGFAQQSGGTLEIVSAVGKGTTVRLYLPVPETST